MSKPRYSIRRNAFLSSLALTVGLIAGSSGNALAAPPSAPILTGAPSSLTSSRDASITLSSDDGYAFSCQVDGGDFSTCTSPVELTGLSDGSHSLSVYAVNDDGLSDLTTATWTVDATAPGSPNLTAPSDGSLLASHNATFSGSAEAGATLSCKLDDGDWSACPTPSGPALGDGSRITVGWDTILHWGEASDWSSLSWGGHNPVAGGTMWFGTSLYRSQFTDGAVSLHRLVDVLASSLPCSYLTGIAGSSSTYIIIGTPDHSSSNYYEVNCDDSSLAEVTPPTPARFTNLNDGSHTLAVRATDAAGNQSEIVSATWTVDTTAPAPPSIGTKPATLVNSTSATIAYGGETSASFKCSIDGSDPEPCAESPISLSNLTEGSHTVSITQTDAAGNVSEAANVGWTVDITAPDAPTLPTVPPELTKARKATIAITRAEPGGTLQYRLDSGAWKNCSDTLVFSLLGSGTHTVAIRQRDAAGNVSGSTSTTWTVDTTMPDKPNLTGAPTSPTNRRGASIAVSSLEAGASVECRIDSGAWRACPNPIVFTLLGSGEHTLLVRQRDAAGNSSEPASATWTIDAAPPAAPGLSNLPAAITNQRGASITITRAESGGTLQCRLDSSSWAACTSPRTFTLLHAGPHTFNARQIDAAGNVGPAASAAWTIDVAPPAKPSLSGVPASPTTSRSATITVTRAEAGGSLQCKLDAASWSACDNSVTLSGLTVGVRVLLVRQLDAAGNAGAFAKATWRVK